LPNGSRRWRKKSDDKKVEGHMMEFKGKNFKVGIDKLTSYRFVLPRTTD